MNRHPLTASLCAGIIALGLSSCAVGPDYKAPQTQAAPSFAEQGPWKVAAPKDALPKGEWWKTFGDPDLNALESQAIAASPTLKVALARFDQALAAARISRSALLPSATVNGSMNREHYSGNRQAEFPATRFAYVSNSFDLPLDLTYEVDLFGSARRSLESATAVAQAQGALYQNVLLTLEAGVAQNYFTLRSLYLQREYLQQNVALLKDALELVQKLRTGGANSDLDLYQAQAQLAIVESTALATDQRIADGLHALAVLVGSQPEGLQVKFAASVPNPPDIPVGLPSELLERRPDIAAAERTLAAANAQIGVAKAAFFPSIGITAFGGLNSNDLNTLLRGSSKEWALAPVFSLPVFKAGALRASYDQAKDLYTQALESYHAQVLTAFQEVEDGLSDSRYLRDQEDALQRAVDASQGALNLSTIRYKAGLVSYIEVIDAQRSLLQAQLLLTQVRAQRLVSSVLLVKALGGGW